MKYYLLILSLVLGNALSGQQSDYYFPSDNEWATLEAEDLGWCTDSIEALLTELEEYQSKAFILLKDGKIVIESYFDNFTADDSWLWFSAGKSLTAFLVGLAQEEAFLNIEESSNSYLGTGWSNMEADQEDAVTVFHHLSMSTGLDYTVDDPFCTDTPCLSFLNPPGSHWYYHNAPYSLLRKVLENATGQNINNYTFRHMHQKIGMDGLWVRSGFNNFFTSTPRSMARFGLLMLAGGNWDGDSIMRDSDYFELMTRPSTEQNPSYGLLWWLNGQEKHKVPGTDEEFEGSINPDGADEMYCAIGAGGQILCVDPSQDIVFVRMGLSSNSELVPVDILKSITNKLNDVICNNSTSISDALPEERPQIIVYPNPSCDEPVNIRFNDDEVYYYFLKNLEGRTILETKFTRQAYINPGYFESSGMYILSVYKDNKQVAVERLIRY